MTTHFTNWTNRGLVALIVMGVPLIGIPFIPFIPLAMLFGCWKLEDVPGPRYALGETIPSMTVTVVIGLAFYTWFINWV